MNSIAATASTCPTPPLDFSQTSNKAIIGTGSTAVPVLRTRPSCAVLLGHDVSSELGTRVHSRADASGVLSLVSRYRLAAGSQLTWDRPGYVPTMLALVAHGLTRDGVHRVTLAPQIRVATRQLIQGERAAGYSGLICVSACEIGLAGEQLSDLPGPILLVGGSGAVLSSTGDETLLYLIGALGSWHRAHPDTAPSPAAMLAYANMVAGDTVALVGDGRPPVVREPGSVQELELARPDKRERALGNRVMRGEVPAVAAMLDRWPGLLNKQVDGWTPLKLALLEKQYDMVAELTRRGASWGAYLGKVVPTAMRKPALCDAIAAQLSCCAGDLTEASKLLQDLRWHEDDFCPLEMATQLCKPDPAEHVYGQFITHLFAHMARRLPQLFTADRIRMVALDAAHRLLMSLADPELSQRALDCLDAGRADLLDSMSLAAWRAWANLPGTCR